MSASGNLLRCMEAALADHAAYTEWKDNYNAAAVLSSTEIGYLDSVTAGTAAASKAMVTSSSNGIGSLTLLAIGAAIPTNPQAKLALLPAANASGVTANQSYFHGQILPGGAVTIPAGTAPVVASLNIHEPNITATGTVTAAATVRIVDAPTEGSSNYALWVDAGSSRFDGNIDQAAAALDHVVIANTAAALEFSDGTTKIVTLDTRNTVKNTAAVTIIPSPVTIATEAAVHTSAAMEIPARTITYTGALTVTSLLGTALRVGATTVTDAGAGTITTLSAIHIDANAAAAGSLTITNSLMISTSVPDCYLTNAGVWTDTASSALIKNEIEDAEPGMLDKIISSIRPRSWKYKPEVTGNDHNRLRIGIVAQELGDFARIPGQEGDGAMSGSLLGSINLALIKRLSDRIDELTARLEGKFAAA